MKPDSRVGTLGYCVVMTIHISFINLQTNSIWKINDDGGKEAERFKDIVGAAISHFETLFQDDTNLNLSELLKISSNFPSSISDEENFDLMKPVTLEEM